MVQHFYEKNIRRVENAMETHLTSKGILSALHHHAKPFFSRETHI
jgi:HJR/Mrr/RecB family endonuclease